LVRSNGFVNYELEAILAISIILALTLYEYINTKQVFLTTLILFQLLASQFYINGTDLFPMPDKAYTRAVSDVQSIIKDTDKAVLTENGALVLNIGKKDYFDPSTFCSLINMGLWPKQRLMDDLEKGNIEYIILRNPYDQDGLITVPGVVDTIDKHYEIIYYNENRFGLYSLCVYKYRGY
jgi:hypothetical protein